SELEIGHWFVIKGNDTSDVYDKDGDFPLDSRVAEGIATANAVREELADLAPRTVSIDGLKEYASDLFRIEDVELFPNADLPVRLYTTSGFTDRAPGYSQTATPEGLRVAVPTAGSGSNTHYLTTG